MFLLSESFVEEIGIDEMLSASLYHRSARHLASNQLKAIGATSEIFDSWDTLGRAVINLYASMLTLNAIQCRSPAKATLARSALSIIILKSVSHAVTHLALFGPGVKSSGRDADSSREAVALQLIGALAANQGYSSVVEKILSKIPAYKDVLINVEKDAKTTLQERLQAQRFPLATYETIKVSGPANSPLFTIKLSVNSLNCIGEGNTKKSAEQDAAKKFLASQFNTSSTCIGIDFSKKFVISEMAKSLPELSNSTAVNILINNLKLPNWSRKIFQLSLVHSSYDLRINPQPLGKDNKLLAFIGSDILQWLSRDAIINGLSPREISLSGGVTPLAIALNSEKSLTKIFDQLELKNALLLGRGEKKILPSTKVEYVQAYIAALFLSCYDDVSDCASLIRLQHSLRNHFIDNIEKFALPRDALISPKTLFQERFQPIFLSVRYDTICFGKPEQITLQPNIYIKSPWVEYPLRITGRSENSAANESRRKIEIEGDLASSATGCLDVVIGTFRNFNPICNPSSQYIQKWFLMHTLGAIKSYFTQGIQHTNAGNIISDFFGTQYIKQNDFQSFSNWHQMAYDQLYISSSHNVDVDVLCKFYGWSGQVGNSYQKTKKLLSVLNEIEDVLISVDPLDNVDIKKMGEFERLVKEASIYKILGSSAKKTTLSEVSADANLLFKHNSINLLSSSLEQDTEFLMLDGTLIALFNIFCDEKFRHLLSEDIIISIKSTELQVVIGKRPDTHSSVLDDLSSDSLWQILKRVMPILDMTEDGDSITITIHACAIDGYQENIFRYWLAYNLQGNLGTAKSDTVAALLHDLKNLVLGYAAAATNARSISSTRLKYEIAAQAGKHVEEALSVLRVLRFLFKSAPINNIEEFSGENFFKIAITSLLSILPDEIKLKATLGKVVRPIWTSQDMLKSIVDNLTKNAIEAMPLGGTLSIEYFVHESDDSFEFFVSDTGTGFSESELQTLNSGLPINSKKRSGQGIGILTILLLTKELGGFAKFENNKGIGCTITIRIPSAPPLDFE